MEKAKRLATGWLAFPRMARHCAWTGPLRAIALLLLLTALAGCERAAPEQRLREQLDAMQAALSERRPAEFIEGVSEGFSGKGGMDRAAAHNLLRVQLLTNQRIGTSTGPIEVEMHQDRATVRFTVIMTGSSGRILPDRMQAYRVTSGWREEEGQWRVYYADWTSD